MARRPGTQVVQARRSRVTWLLPLGLLALVATIYAPAWHGGLLWDDPAHITRADLRSLSGLWRIWFEVGATQQYYPLLHSAFWLQWQMWGDAVLGYHLVNIALHALSACLVALVVIRLGIPGALLAAVLFAVHPVHVESVAWISELKNTLSTALFLAATLAFLRWDAERTRRTYAIASALFIGALLTKTVAATWPAAMLVVIWWQRGTLRWRADVQPLLPHFAVGAAAGMTTAWLERTQIGAEGAEYALTFVERTLIAGRAFWFYLSKLAWPSNLTFVYPRWTVSTGEWWQFLYPAALLLLFAVLWGIRRRSRAPLAAVLLFLGLLFPVLGFLNVYPFRFSFVADHFQYLASIPILVAAAAALSLLLGRARVREGPGMIVATLVLAAPLAVLAWQLAHDYASAEALYRATLARNPSAWLAHNNLGLILVGRRDVDEARGHFAEAARLNPRVPEHHANLGRLELQSGATDAALTHFDAALALDPDLPNVRSDRGVALLRGGRLDEALAEFARALHLAPEHPEARTNMAFAHRARGVTRMQAGDTAGGIADLTTAVRLRPDDPDFRNDLGVALVHAGKPAEAAAEFEAALRLRPDFREARQNLGRLRR